jgi:TP901 family phage tail tape measure protein
MAGDLGTLKAVLALDTDRFESSMKSVRSSMDRAGDQMKKAGQTMSKNVSLPLSIVGGMGVKTFADFEAAMNQVNAVSQATGEQMKQMEAVARDLGSTTKFSATQAAEGMNFLSMAGFNVQETIAALPSTLNLAAAGNMKLGASADIVSNIMQGFGKSADETGEVVDILTKAFTSSNTNLRQLGDAMSYAAPVAKAFGQNIEDTTAAVGIMSDAGIQASKAGTGLRQTFLQLQKKSDKLGISVKGAQGNMLPLADILEQIENSGMKTSKVIDIVGSRAGTALAAMLDRGSDALRDFSDELGNAGGTAEQVASTQMEGIKGAFTELKSALSELAISFTDPLADSIESFVDKVKGVIQWLGNLDERTKKIITTIAGIAAAIGPVLVVMGTFTKGIGKLIGVAGNAITMLRSLWAVMMANPVTAVVAGLAAITTAIIALSDKTDIAAQVQNRLNDAAAKATEGLRSQKAELSVLEGELDQINSRINEQKLALKNAEKGSEDYRIKVENLKDAQKDREQIIDKINKKYGDYLENEIKMSDTYTEIKNKLDAVNARLQAKIKLQALEAKTQEARKAAVETQKKITELKSKESNLTEENAKKELNWLQKLKSGYMAVAELNFDFKGEQLEDAKELTDEQISENRKKYQAFLDQYSNYQSKLNTMMEKLGIGPSEEKVKKEGQDDGETYAEEVKRSVETAEKPELPAPDISMPDISGVEKGGDITMGGLIPKGIDQAATKIAKVNEQLKDYSSLSQRATLANIQYGKSFDQLTNKQQQNINQQIRLQETASRAAQTIKRATVDMAAQVIKAFGNMAAGGEMTGKKLFTGLLQTMSSLMERLGKMALGVAIGIEGIKKSLQSLNPAAAVAAGITLLALAGAVSAVASNLAETGGESGGSETRNIPKMAAGGQVPSGYPNDTYPAMLSSKEVVAPPEKLPQMNEQKEESLVAHVNGSDIDFVLKRWNKEKDEIT